MLLLLPSYISWLNRHMLTTVRNTLIMELYLMLPHLQKSKLFQEEQGKYTCFPLSVDNFSD